MISVSELTQRLTNLPVKLNDGADKEEIDRLEKFIGVPLDPYIVHMYEEFNGFKDGDFEVNSFISIWPIEKIIECNLLAGSQIRFADSDFDAIMYCANFGDAYAPVAREDTGKIISNSFYSFLEELSKEELK